MNSLTVDSLGKCYRKNKVDLVSPVEAGRVLVRARQAERGSEAIA